MTICRKTTRLLLLVLIPLLGLSACRPKEVDLPFETIEQGDWGNAGYAYEAHRPTLMVITRATEVMELDDWITLDAQTQLQALDYDAYFAVVVFQGWKATTGYKVQVDHIALSGNVINVHAQFLEPKPEEEKAPEATSPYHLVTVQRAKTWDQDITFNLVVDEVVVVSLSRHVP